MVHYPLVLAHWLSLWYTLWYTLWYITVFYWPTGYLNGTLPSLIGPLAISMEHYCIPMANWLTPWYTILPYWPNGYPYGKIVSSTGPLDISYGMLLSPIGSLVIHLVHYYHLLANWISLWYTTLSYWATCHPYGTLLSSTGPMDISLVHCYPSTNSLDIPMLHYPLLLAHWISLWYTPLSY